MEKRNKFLSDIETKKEQFMKIINTDGISETINIIA